MYREFFRMSRWISAGDAEDITPRNKFPLRFALKLKQRFRILRGRMACSDPRVAAKKRADIRAAGLLRMGHDERTGRSAKTPRGEH